MNKASERYNTKVEIPISVILETIFSDDNKDVETLCRWAKHYGFVDLVKENEEDKLGYYKLQDDYTKQSFYVWLDKEERKQYDYEDFLLDKIEEKDKEIERLSKEVDMWNRKYNEQIDIMNELEKYINKEFYVVGNSPEGSFYEGYDTCLEEMKQEILNKLKELKEGK